MGYLSLDLLIPKMRFRLATSHTSTTRRCYILILYIALPSSLATALADSRLLPASLLYAGNLTLVSQISEAYTANTVFTEYSVRTTADAASGVGSGGKFSRFLLLIYHCFLSHFLTPLPYLFAKGIPSNASNSLASSSVLAVVVIQISKPLTFST